jgi:hypothetical protein
MGYNEEFSERDSKNAASHRAFAEVPWFFASAEMFG